MNAQRPTDIFCHHSTLMVPTPSSPWKLGTWLWATNGHLLVAVLDDGTASTPTPEARVKVKAARYLETIPADAAPVSLLALRVFAGDESKPEACDACHGEGYENVGDLTTCEHCGQSTRNECEECGGDGLSGVIPRFGRVAGVPVNLNLLAYALTFVPDDGAAQIGSIENLSANVRTHRALIVMAPMWRIGVMSVHEEAATGAPCFPSTQEASPAGDAVDPQARERRPPRV